MSTPGLDFKDAKRVWEYSQVMGAKDGLCHMEAGRSWPGRCPLREPQEEARYALIEYLVAC